MTTKSELKKALTTTGNGAALQPYNLDPVLNEELLKMQPLAQLIEVLPAGGKTHEWNARTSHPLGWFEGEATPANPKNSTYVRKSTQLKIQRIWGSVTGFAQSMDAAFIDALTAELEGSLEGMSNVLEYGLMWGAADDLFTGDAYQYSGIFPHLAKNASGNIINGAGAKISLDLMDQAIAKLTGYRGVGGDPKMWLMGLRMKQIVDGLQTKVSIPLTSSVLNDGQITMPNYGDIPIDITDFLTPEAVTTSPAATAELGDNSGKLAAAAYTYRVASVTMYGEQVAGTASSAVTADATHNKVAVSWIADDKAVLYLIFRKAGTGKFQLLDTVNALTYDAAGTVSGARATYTDDGSKTPVATVEPLEDGEQNILLINRNPRRGVAFLSKVDDMGRSVDNMFSYVELARVKDTYDYMVKGYLGLRVMYPNVAGSMIRRVKLIA